MHYSLIEKVCAANYPILVGIVKNLSSTDTSAFLYATGLWRLVGDGFMKRFMTIERELSFISGCGEWIDDLRERGDTVLVVGDAVNILMNRYNRLVSYWTDVKNGIITSNCKVWIIGVSRVGYVVTRLDAHRSVYGVDLAEVDNYKMSESGEIVRLDGPGRACPGGCHGSICKSLLPVGTPLLPGPGKWPRCVTDWILEADIYSPNISVMNNGGFSVYCIQDTTSDGIDTTIYTNSQYIDVSGSLPTSRGSRRSLTYLNMNTGVITHSFACDEQTKTCYRQYTDPSSVMISSGFDDDYEGVVTITVKLPSNDTPLTADWFRLFCGHVDMSKAVM